MTGVRKPDEADKLDRDGARPQKIEAAVLTFAVLGVFLYFIRFILVPFALAGAIAFILSLLVDLITAKIGWPRKAVAAVIFCVFIAACTGIGFIAYQPAANQLSQFVTDLRGALTNAFEGIAKEGQIHILGNTYNAEQLADQVQNMVREWIGQPGNLAAIAGASFSAVFSIFLCAVILFYFMVGGGEIVSSLVGLAPPSQRELIKKIVVDVRPVLQRYFAGVGVIVAYAGVAAYLGLGLILGVRHAVILAVATGILEMIPVIGPLAAAVLAGLVALQGATSLWFVLEYALYATILRLSIDQLFGPIILGRAASLSPITIIFCFLAGGILYGIAGVILAVPLALSIRIALKAIYAEPA